MVFGFFKYESHGIAGMNAGLEASFQRGRGFDNDVEMIGEVGEIVTSEHTDGLAVEGDAVADPQDAALLDLKKNPGRQFG